MLCEEVDDNFSDTYVFLLKLGCAEVVVSAYGAGNSLQQIPLCLAIKKKISMSFYALWGLWQYSYTEANELCYLYSLVLVASYMVSRAFTGINIHAEGHQAEK